VFSPSVFVETMAGFLMIQSTRAQNLRKANNSWRLPQVAGAKFPRSWRNFLSNARVKQVERCRSFFLGHSLIAGSRVAPFDY
jgi:hypothetical protein